MGYNPSRLIRSKTTKDLIFESCGGNSYLLSSLHHGLFEVPLDRIYPLLNLDELIGFAASSWVGRNRQSEDLRKVLQTEDFLEVFGLIWTKYGEGWLQNKRRDYGEFQDKLIELRLQLNPFPPESWEDRVVRAKAEDLDTIMGLLLKPTLHYHFLADDKEVAEHRMRGDESYVIMDFQTVYPHKRSNELHYAEKINRILHRYPHGIVDFSSTPEDRTCSCGQLPLLEVPPTRDPGNSQIILHPKE